MKVEDLLTRLRDLEEETPSDRDQVTLNTARTVIEHLGRKWEAQGDVTAYAALFNTGAGLKP